MKFEDNKVIIIGICGGTCSGKSTISQKIKEFYKDKGVSKLIRTHIIKIILN